MLITVRQESSSKSPQAILILVPLGLLCQVETCTCEDGIGSSKGEEPLSEYIFRNGQTLIICGYSKNQVYSEFDVFDCDLGESISRYGAVQNCKVDYANDTLKVIELKYLPSGDNWKWQLESIAVEYITSNAEQSFTSFKEPAFDQLYTTIPKFKQEEFLDYFHLNLNNRLQHDWKWDELIGKLEVIALTGNQRAIDLLLNLEELSNYKLDAAYKEQHNDAVSTLNWIIKK